MFIVFDDICKAFHSERAGCDNVIEHVSFCVSCGEFVCLLGRSGCGKTTLLSLIPRFYDVGEGAVLIDGKDIRDFPISVLRKAIGIAFQDIFLFSDTVDGNIAYGDVDLAYDDMKHSAVMADADSFIEKMPEGYDTIIGERGVGLSGGQKQRIALARALAIKPRILILDDTTSAVDMETEKYIQDQLASIDHECTKIIVAQRISAVRNADKIIILANNTIAEAGTHDELIALDGYYAEIFSMAIAFNLLLRNRIKKVSKFVKKRKKEVFFLKLQEIRLSQKSKNAAELHLCFARSTKQIQPNAKFCYTAR